MRTRTVTTAVALGTTVLALAGAAACGRSPAHSGIASAGGTGSASAHPTASVDPEEQARAFAQCMREHGVDMPDPETVGGGGSGSGGGGVRITVTGAPGAGMDAAMNACKDKLPNGGTPPSMSPEQQEQLRAFAQCMRDHGVDMPDPDPNSGGLRISSSGGPAFGPDDPTFKAAQEACQEKLPGALSGKGGTVTNGGGDGGGPGFSVGGGK
jgi:hypothetical protein